MASGVSDDGNSFIFRVKQSCIKVLSLYLTENTVKVQLFFQSQLIPHREHNRCTTVTSTSALTLHRTRQLGNHHDRCVTHTTIVTHINGIVCRITWLTQHYLTNKETNMRENTVSCAVTTASLTTGVPQSVGQI